MENVSAAYHTLISTCRMNGISALNYLKTLFREIIKGHNENLLPMIIGINTNNIKKRVHFLIYLRGNHLQTVLSIRYVKVGRLLKSGLFFYTTQFRALSGALIKGYTLNLVLTINQEAALQLVSQVNIYE